MRLHPFTPLLVTTAVAVSAFLLPGPWGPPGLYGLAVAAAVAARVPKSVRDAALLCLPLWVFLFLLHGVLGEGPHLTVGGVALAEHGLEQGLAQGARLGAIATATLALMRLFEPARFVDAVAARGGSFHAAYLVVATLQAVPRLRARTGKIREAQRTRGLRVGGSPVRRVRALAPLALPLVLGALSDAEDRAMALRMRGVDAGARRTPLDPPRVGPADRVIRWAALVLVAGAAAWRFG